MLTSLLPLLEYSSSLATNLIKAWESGNKSIRTFVTIGAILGILSILLITVNITFYTSVEYLNISKILKYLFFIFAFLSFTSLLISSAYIENKEREKGEKIIIEKELRVSENPNEPKLAWDLARLKLESYINKNINQVISIFYMSVFVMLVGFSLIIYGSVMSFKSQGNLQPSIIVAVSGIIVNFIGASFLIIYKSVMEQAKEYVNVLERINAVGMSVQVIESIQDEHSKLKEETKAELAKKLIDLYSSK